MGTTRVKHTVIYSKLIPVIEDIVKIIKAKVKRGEIPHGESGHIEIRKEPNKMPKIREVVFPPQTEVPGIVLKGNATLISGFPIIVDKIDGYLEYIKYIKDAPELKEKFGYGTNEEINEGTFTFDLMRNLIIELAERYLSLHPNKKFENRLFEKIYVEKENWIFSNKLTFNVVVPILNIEFDFENLSITDNLSIQKMDEKFQIARCSRKLMRTSQSDLLSGATHGLYYKNQFLENHKLWGNSFSSQEVYPIEIIDAFFTLVKIFYTRDVGYGHILVEPKGWARDYYENRIPIEGLTLKKFPDYFNFWDFRVKDPVKITEKEVLFLKKIYRDYLDLNKKFKKKIEAAIRRLNDSFLRTNETDKFIDLIIVLEALLNDSSKTEISFKLASRIATLLSVFKKTNIIPGSIFKSVKEICVLRGNILHKGIEHKKRKVELSFPDGKVEKEIIDLTLEYSILVLQVLLQNPVYFEPKEIDNLLFSLVGIPE